MAYCAVEFPSAYAYAEVVEAYSVSAVHVVEAYVWAVFFQEFEGFEFVLEHQFAEAHVVFFADAAYLVDVFGDYEGYVDVGVV